MWFLKHLSGKKSKPQPPTGPDPTQNAVPPYEPPANDNVTEPEPQPEPSKGPSSPTEQKPEKSGSPKPQKAEPSFYAPLAKETTPWRTFSVFISSTFADMQAERDHLKNVVFPLIQCIIMGYYFVKLADKRPGNAQQNRYDSFLREILESIESVSTVSNF